MYNLIKVEFYNDKNEFGGTLTVEYPNSTIKFSGDYLIVENNKQVGQIFNLGTVKMYKIVSQ